MPKVIGYRYVTRGGKRCLTQSDLVREILLETGQVSQQEFMDITGKTSFSTSLTKVKRDLEKAGIVLASQRSRANGTIHFIPDFKKNNAPLAEPPLLFSTPTIEKVSHPEPPPPAPPPPPAQVSADDMELMGRFLLETAAQLRKSDQYLASIRKNPS